MSPQYSRTQRSSACRVVQKDLSFQPEFFLRGLPFLRCSTHWRGSLTILRFVLSCAMSRFEGCAGPERMTGKPGAGGGTLMDSRALVCDRGRSSSATNSLAMAERFDKMPL